VQDASAHPRFKYFRDIGEDAYRTFLGVPIMDRGVLQGVLVVQTTDARLFSDEDSRLLAQAGVQLAPIVSEARTEGQFIAPVHRRLAALARNLWWSWDSESVGLFRDLDPVLWQCATTTPSRCCSKSTCTSSRYVPRSSPCTDGSTTRTGGCRSI